MSLIGLDIGTTGCKALAFEEDGRAIAESYREYNRVGTAVHELDAEEVWRTVQEVLRSVCSQCKARDLKALAVSSFGESVIPLNREDRVLHNSILYTDPRGAEQCQALSAQFGSSTIMAKTGLKPHPMYSLSKIGWYRDCLPEVFRQTARYMLFEDFILWRLGAEPSIDYSLASRTMAFNVTKMAWEEDLLEACGIHAGMFSRAVPSGTAAGRIRVSVAQDLGLPQGLLLVTGGHDQVCAAVGAGVLSAGTALDGTGTVECIAPVFDSPVLEERFVGNNYACVPYALPGTYTTYAFNFTGGSLLKWYRDNFAAVEVAQARAQGISAYDLLNAGASKEPTDLIVIPHFAGSGTPQMDTKARGAILGLRFESDAPTVYRALMEGVTYEMAYNMEFLRSNGIAIGELRAVGGGARSDLWLGIKAAITGCRVLSLESGEAGVAGAAMLAGKAAGVYHSLEEAIPCFVRVRREIEPDPHDRAIYQENYERFKQARSLLSGLYG